MIVYNVHLRIISMFYHGKAGLRIQPAVVCIDIITESKRLKSIWFISLKLFVT